ncbi:hypothetical protein K439DRAFT_1346423 [Ramaria rubella]|nr:hypothetical protein K439DRAFT_1346423 [Ramaria rubella]
MPGHRSHDLYLAPIRKNRAGPSQTYSSSSEIETSTRQSCTPSSRERESTTSLHPPTHRQSYSHSFDLFNVTQDEGLVHKGSSAQDDLDESRSRSRTSTSSDTYSRKYACPECGKRFAKPSTLKNHSLTHTGEKPFTCTYPGCDKRFSMASNMQRHMKTHSSGSAFQDLPVLEDDQHDRNVTPSRSSPRYWGYE